MSKPQPSRKQPKGSSSDPHIKPALIGALAVVAAALISFLGILLSQNDKSRTHNAAPPSQTPAPTPVVTPAPNLSFEQRLKRLNISLTDDPAEENQMRQRLVDDGQTRAVANSCFLLLESGGQKIKGGRSIPLNVLQGYYREELGYDKSENLSTSKYGDLELLKRAIRRAWLQRNKAESADTPYESMVEPISP